MLEVGEWHLSVRTLKKGILNASDTKVWELLPQDFIKKSYHSMSFPLEGQDI